MSVIAIFILYSDDGFDLRCKGYAREHNITLSADIDIHELLYADDTLLIDVSGSNLQLYMECIAKNGKVYGMSFHSSKLEVLPVRCEGHILNEH